MLFHGLRAGGRGLLFTKEEHSRFQGVRIIHVLEEHRRHPSSEDDIGQADDVEESGGSEREKTPQRASIPFARHVKPTSTVPLGTRFSGLLRELRKPLSRLTRTRPRRDRSRRNKNTKAANFGYPTSLPTSKLRRRAVKIEAGAKSDLDHHSGAEL